MNILLVDDKEENRKFLKQFLMAKGYIVSEAENGQTAIDLCVKNMPDLVLMDIMMPGINGQQAVSFIKSIKHEIYLPIIYVTALSAEEAMADALEAGGDDFISKPVDLNILESKIKAHLRIRHDSMKLRQLNKDLERHNERVQEEHRIVEDIFKKAIDKSYLDEQYIKYHMSPASAFNGDLLLAARRPDGGVTVFLGDFTGHGLPAAMGTLPVVQVFYTMVSKGIAIDEIAAELNRVLKMLLPVNIFCCANLVEIDASATSLSMWSGGLPDALLLNLKENQVSVIKSMHMPLGILAEDSFDNTLEKFQVSDDHKLYLYTDGVTEARDAEGKDYGIERLNELVSKGGSQVFEAILKDHEDYTGSSQQDDDITLIELGFVELSPLEA